MTASDEEVGTAAPPRGNASSDTAATVRLRTRRASVDPAAQLAALREQLRAEVLDEELQRLCDTIVSQQKTIETMSAKIDDLTTLVGELGEIERGGIEELVQQLKNGAIPVAGESTLPALPSIEEPTREEPEGIYVNDAFLDFLQVFSYHSHAVVERAALLAGLRTSYDDKGRFVLSIRQGGTLGTEFHMRNVKLSLSTGDADSDSRPYVEGNYTDGARVVPLTEAQVERILETLYNEAVRFYDPEPATE